ncbi:uncharacterized protein [Spinacia oleracea]|uniref:Granulins domain-containing protein n=1 Tax=Spinacia oleracea TaxID=3562 RepID=A0ABM3R593_SPIOL|nr:uncharacterized protein LOC130466070 [Spinacia oleracea]
MEGKHQRINIIAVLILLSLVQLMSSGKVVGCGTGSDGCGAFNWCCDGYHCSNLLSGGVCEQDRCRFLGEGCAISPWDINESCCEGYTCNYIIEGFGHCTKA